MKFAAELYLSRRRIAPSANLPHPPDNIEQALRLSQRARLCLLTKGRKSYELAIMPGLTRSIPSTVGEKQVRPFNLSIYNL
jgi:hypothetical protein